jgi:branched-chain amino acid transport system permease protein
MKSVRAKRIVYLVVAIIIVVVPLITKSRYQMHLFILAGIYVLLASGLNLISGYVGLLSLCHGAFFGIGAYTSALLSVRLGSPFLANFIASALTAATIAYLFGLVTLRVRGSACVHYHDRFFPPYTAFTSVEPGRLHSRTDGDR